MRRLDNALEMDRLLLAGAVQPAQMEQLAEILVKFHHDVTLHHYADCEPGAAWADFADIANHVGLIEKYFGAPAAADLQSRLPELEKQLHHHDKRLQQRAREGFWVEGHGDLHSRNIFLTNPPLAFDCIEFSAHLRKMDLLNELAFLAMDLDFYHRPDLAKIFLHAYLKRRNIMPQPEDRQLFVFFKAYRANVRLKIGLLEMEQHPSQVLVENTRRYWQLFGQYLTTLLTAGF
jgi:aminoglycoside phosphotransferase family enzyme